MIFHPAQSQIAKDKHRFRVVNCGRRFGKTTLAIYEMIGAASGIDNASIAYVAPTYQQARDIVWDQLKNICQPVLVGKPNESRLEINIKNKFGSSSRIALRGWESIETLRGQAFDLIVLDEVSSYKNYWVNWQEVLRPTLTNPGKKGKGLFISTPKGFNHFYDLSNLGSKDEDYTSFHFTSYANPHLPLEELDKARVELTEDRFAQEYLADFRKTEGLVYKEFYRDRHVFSGDFKDRMKGHVKVFGGVDFGFTNPAAVITIHKDGDGNYFITDEWYRRGQTDAQIADYVAALRWNECYPDPESAGGCEELRRKGVNTREVLKNKDSVRSGINVVRELFKANRLFIHESCRNLIWELETYSYPEKKSEHNEQENPIKENDHACFVAGTLIQTKEGDVPIEQVMPGDLVWTPFGFSKVLKSEKMGVKDVFDYGAFICTKNHPVLSTQGVTPVDVLSYNSLICKTITKQFTLMEYLIAGILTQKREVKEFIFGALLIRNLEAKQDIYTEIFGNITKERSLKDILFTIKTGTITTLLPILSLLLKKNTLNFTSGEVGTDNENILNEYNHLLNSGMLLKLEKNGMLSMDEILGKIKCQYLKFVLNAVESTILFSLVVANSAITTVKPKHLGREDVYNLATEDGMYFANGLLVSNCDAMRYALSMESLSIREMNFVPSAPILPYYPEIGF